MIAYAVGTAHKVLNLENHEPGKVVHEKHYSLYLEL